MLGLKEQTKSDSGVYKDRPAPLTRGQYRRSESIRVQRLRKIGMSARQMFHARRLVRLEQQIQGI